MTKGRPLQYALLPQDVQQKTFECKTKDIAVHEGIYFDMLEEMFTMVTGLYTRF